MILNQLSIRARIVFLTALVASIALATAACGETAPETNAVSAATTLPATTLPPTALSATAIPETALPPTTVPATTVPPTAATSVDVDTVGDLFVVGSGSEATFTVNEKLSLLPLPNDAVLRTADISGDVDLSNGTASLVINLHALKSDQSRRDRFVRDRMFPRQPEATISITGFPEIPDSFAGGEPFSSTVTATVNVNGTDAEIEFTIEARLDPDRLLVLVKGDFVWADFGMTAPVSRAFVVKDDVHVEVLVSAVRQ